MIFEFKPYPAYKPSGVEWLGEVPEHWHIVPVKRYYSIQLGKMLQPQPTGYSSRQVHYLKARNIQWFDIDLSNLDMMYASNDEIVQYEVRSGDLLVCEGGEGGRCAIVDNVKLEPIIIQNALHRVRPLSNDNLGRNDYLQYVLRVVSSTGWFDALNNRATIAHFTAEKFGGLNIPAPPLTEQTAIAHFLDHATNKIERHILEKQKLIILLEEYKQAIIHQAVTGQIDVRTGQPYLAYKPSGVEWLGDVPEHWEVHRLKSVAHQISEVTYKSQDDMPYIALENVESWTGRVTANCTETTVKQLKLFEQGDVLFGKLRPYLAKVLCTKSRGQCVSEFMVLRATDRISQYFLEHLLRSKLVIGWINSAAFGAKMPRTDWHFVGNTRLAVPPFSEQTAIADFLDNVIAKTVKITDHTKRQIELLQEYRTRLIADAVTGKIDVCEAAAELQQTNFATCGDETNSTLSNSISEYQI